MEKSFNTPLVTLVLVVVCASTAGALECYVCTYLFSGHTGISGYDCVNNTANFTNTIKLPCELPKKCMIKTVYERDYTRLLSMVKNCLLPTQEHGCDKPEAIRPTCFFECTTDLCNVRDGDLKPGRTGQGVNVQSQSLSLLLGFVISVLFNST